MMSQSGQQLHLRRRLGAPRRLTLPAAAGMQQYLLGNRRTHLTAISARRDTVLFTERAAEVRRVAEAPAKADVGYRQVSEQRIDEVRATAFQAEQAHVVREGFARGFKQLLQVARRDAETL